MMNELTTFDFEDFAVRVVTREGEPWFVASDVCRVLELMDATSALRCLDEDEKITLHNERGNPRAGIPHQFNIISESGLYALIFTSRKPEAKKFRKWVTSEVLPAIRKTGVYAAPTQEPTTAPTISLLRFVEKHCSAWSLDRQIEFGHKARSFSKAMGVVFQVATDPEMGRLFHFPTPVLLHVHSRYAQTALLPDSDAVEFQKLLDAVLVGSEEGVLHPAELLRGIAKTMRLFPRIFGKETSLASERSGFGKLVERFNGYVFPGGECCQIRRRSGKVAYEVRREPSRRAALVA